MESSFHSVSLLRVLVVPFLVFMSVVKSISKLCVHLEGRLGRTKSHRPCMQLT